MQRKQESHKYKLLQIFHWARQNKYIRKIVFYACIILLLWVIYLIAKEPVVNILKKNAISWAIFTHISQQITEKTYLGLYYAALTGSLVFAILPIEIISIYYFAQGYNAFLVIIISVAGMITGLTIDYLIGYVFGAKILKYFMKGKYQSLGVEMIRTSVIPASINTDSG